MHGELAHTAGVGCCGPLTAEFGCGEISQAVGVDLAGAPSIFRRAAVELPGVRSCTVQQRGHRQAFMSPTPADPLKSLASVLEHPGLVFHSSPSARLGWSLPLERFQSDSSGCAESGRSEQAHAGRLYDAVSDDILVLSTFTRDARSSAKPRMQIPGRPNPREDTETREHGH
jgi:hypothetical protein